MAITVVRRLQTEERNRLAGKEKASRRGGLKGNARLSEDQYPRSQSGLSGRDFGDSITRTGVASGKSLERAGSLESRFLKSNGRLPVGRSLNSLSLRCRIGPRWWPTIAVPSIEGPGVRKAGRRFEAEC